MTMHRSLIAAVALLATPLSGLAAQDLLEVYELARRQDPTLASAEAATGAADARYRQARGQLLPNISGNASVSKVKQEDDFGDTGGGGFFGGGGDSDNDEEFEDQHSYTVDLRQPLFNWSAWQAKDAAAVRSEQSELELAAAAGDLIVRTARRYFDVLAAQVALESAQRRSEVIQAQLDRARAAYESGLAPITDLQQAQSELDSAKVDAISAENDLANSRDALSQLTGSVHPELAAALPPYDVTPPEDELDAWVERAVAQNPQLAAMEKALTAAREDIDQARGGHFPVVDLTGSVGESERTVDFGFGDTQLVTETQAVGVEMSVPIFAGGATAAAVDEAYYTSMQARQDFISTRRQVEVDTRTAYRDVQASAARVKALRQAIASGETAVKAAKAGLRNGTRNILDVLQAEIDLIQRHGDLKRAWYDYAVAGLRLKFAAGSLTPEDLQRVNQRLEDTVDAARDVPSEQPSG